MHVFSPADGLHTALRDAIAEGNECRNKRFRFAPSASKRLRRNELEYSTMFDTGALEQLVRKHKKTLTSVLEVQTALNEQFFGMDLSVACMMLASLTGESMLMIGPPGTAKSLLIRNYCHMLGLVDLADAKTPESSEYFEYLLTQFTEPSELFGYYDLAKLFGEKKEFVRDDSGMIQKAQVVFLDEVFNASSAILNALLTFMNEGKFHDRGKIVNVPLRMLFAATNHPPQEEGLAAFYDRFLLRSRVANVEARPDRLAYLLDAAWRETHGAKSRSGTHANLLAAFEAYRKDIDKMTAKGELKIDADHPLFRHLADMVQELRRTDLSRISNRRLVKFAGVMLAKCLLRATENGVPAEVEPGDLEVILDYGLDIADAETDSKLRQHLRRI